MTTQPDPNRHEASRPAFEANFKVGYYGELAECIKILMWSGWQAALDWRDSQVCEWEVDETEYGIRFQADCGHSHTPNFKGEEYKFCPGCGRRVKIQTENSAEQPTPSL